MRRSSARCLTLLALLAAPGACGPTNADPAMGSLGGACYYDGSCDPGLVCDVDTCVEPEGCIPQATQPCTCADQSTGTQVCAASGQWSVCVCTRCGDGLLDADEACDGMNLGTATCATETGLPFGDLTCTADCQALDTSACHGCGNGVIDPGEVCDGADVGTATCSALAAGAFGTLGCDPGCLQFDTSACHSCGDGVIQAGEDCDGAALGGATCANLGLGQGTVTCTGDCTLDTSGCGTVPLAETLEPCTQDDECAAGLFCRAPTKGASKRCVPDCTATAQCPSGMRCLDDGSGDTFCLGSDVGKSCAQASQCNFTCLLGNAYCTVPCADGHDCPNGYGCMAVGDPAQDVCVRAEAYCDGTNNDACIVPAACDVSATMILGGCTLACDTADDCPQRAIPQAPWTCDAGGICRRPADVYGPLPGGWTPTEWYCDAAQNPVVLCNDAQHMNFAQFTVPSPPAVDCQGANSTPGAAGDACVNSCRDQGGCTFGYACVAVGGISGQRVGLCLPTGSVETGAACTSDPQCVHGYCHDGVCSRDCTFDGICPSGLTCTAGGAPAVEGQAFSRCE